jgi:hypothetical protein
MILNNLVDLLIQGYNVTYYEYFGDDVFDDEWDFDYWIEVDGVEWDSLINLDAILQDKRFKVTKQTSTDIESWLIELT